MSRVSEAKVLAESLKLPDGFEFKEYFLSTFGLYNGKSTKEVTLRFTPEKSKWIKDQIWHKNSQGTSYVVTDTVTISTIQSVKGPRIPLSCGVVFPNLSKYEYTEEGLEKIIGTEKIFFLDDLHPMSDIGPVYPNV